MVTLVLLRHAHAEKAMSGQADHSRPLTPEGEAEAARAGAHMAALQLAPDLVLCSTAERTRQTLAGALPALTTSPEIRFLRSLFDGGDYPDIAKAEAGTAKCVVMVGHNPFIQGTAILLAADGADEPERHFPPGAFAVLSAPGDWSSLREGRMRLEHFIRP